MPLSNNTWSRERSDSSLSPPGRSGLEITKLQKAGWHLRTLEKNWLSGQVYSSPPPESTGAPGDSLPYSIEPNGPEDKSTSVSVRGVCSMIFHPKMDCRTLDGILSSSLVSLNAGPWGVGTRPGIVALSHLQQITKFFVLFLFVTFSWVLF